MNYNQLKLKELFIFDMDGTIYLGNKVFDFAIDFINLLRKSKRKILFFTNNASHNKDFYINKLSRMGFSPSNDEILTSGDVTIEFLKKYRKEKKVYLLGTEDLISDFIKNDIKLTNFDNSTPDIVVTSFDTTLNYAKLSKACTYIRNGAEFLSTHPDFNCPTENGFIPDSGSISAFITASTNVTPRYFGKPYSETVEMICEISGIQKNKMCIIGDRLYTDIATGKKHGVTSVLVFTGETKKEDLINCKKEEMPDYAFKSLKEFNNILFG